MNVIGAITSILLVAGVWTAIFGALVNFILYYNKNLDKKEDSRITGNTAVTISTYLASVLFIFAIVGGEESSNIYLLNEDNANLLMVLSFMLIFVTRINLYILDLTKQKKKWDKLVCYSIIQTAIYAALFMRYFGDSFSGCFVFFIRASLFSPCLVLAMHVLGYFYGEFFQPENNANSLYKQADKLYKNKHYSAALDLYKRAYAKDSSTVEYYYYATARTFEALENYSKAIYYLNEASKLPSKNQEHILIKMIDMYKKQQNTQKCLEIFDKLISKYDKSKYQPLKEDFIKNNPIANKSSNTNSSNTQNTAVNQAEQNKREAERLYNQAKALYNNPKRNYNAIILKLNAVLDLEYNQEVSRFLKKVQNEQQAEISRQNNHINQVQQKTEKAEELYTQATYLYNNSVKDYDLILSKLKAALDLVYNKKYVSLSDKVKSEQRQQTLKSEKIAEADALYSSALLAKNRGLFEKAMSDIKKAINIAENNNLNKDKYIDLKIDLTEIIDENNKKNTQNNNQAKTSQKKASKSALKMSNFEHFNDEEYEYVPDSILEIVKRKEQSTSAKNPPKATAKVNKAEPVKQDKFKNSISQIEYFIAVGTYNNALDSIQEAYKHTNGNEAKIKQLQKLEYTITIEKINLEQLISKYDYEGAINLVKSYIEKDSENNLLKQKLQELETLYQEHKNKTLEMNLEQLVSKHDYKGAINLVESNIEKDSENDWLKQKLQEVETSYKEYKNKIEQQFEDYKSSNKYKAALNATQTLVSLEPENERYKELLEEQQNIYDSMKQEMNNLYQEAQDLNEQNDFKGALNKIKDAKEKAILLNIDSATLQEIVECENKTELLEKEQKAVNSIEKRFNTINNSYLTKKFNDDTISKLNKIIQQYNDLKYLKSKKTLDKYKELLDTIQEECDIRKAEDYYSLAVGDFENKDYSQALTNINKALEYYLDDKYKELKKNINAEYTEVKNNEKVKAIYAESLEDYKNGAFEKMIPNLRTALRLKPDNEDCQKLLEKAESGKLDIMTCTKKGLLTLDFITEELADSIIQAREDGMMWYDNEKFSNQFGMQPHQIIMVEEKIEFPLKQADKYGRNLDF